MKLATYQDGSRDGQLVVVSRDLHQAHHATGIATRLQQVLDDWNFLSPQLQDLSVTLNQGKARHAFPFEPRQCMAPLPRAYQWAEAAACLPHLTRLARLRQACGAALPADASSAPLIRLGGSDGFLGPCQDAWFGSAQWDIDFEAGLAVVTGDVAMGADDAQGLDGVRLLLLANGWRLRALEAAEQALGGSQLQSRPAAAFGPVAVTPDELGPSWQGGRVQLRLQSAINGQTLGHNEAGPAMQFHFGQLVAHLARTRHVRAGSIVGSGAVSNLDAGQGFGCIAERRAVEQADLGAPRTPYLAIGDVVRLEMLGSDGLSVFGAIAQRVAGPQAAEPEAAAG
jgi:fumarylacetoacetate (FAA) hydrolase